MKTSSLYSAFRCAKKHTKTGPLSYTPLPLGRTGRGHFSSHGPAQWLWPPDRQVLTLIYRHHFTPNTMPASSGSCSEPERFEPFAALSSVHFACRLNVDSGISIITARSSRRLISLSIMAFFNSFRHWHLSGQALLPRAQIITPSFVHQKYNFFLIGQTFVYPLLCMLVTISGGFSSFPPLLTLFLPLAEFANSRCKRIHRRANQETLQRHPNRKPNETGNKPHGYHPPLSPSVLLDKALLSEGLLPSQCRIYVSTSY